MLELGTGCGVVAFAALLRSPSITVCGIDIFEELCEAARANAAMLGLSERFTALMADASHIAEGTCPGVPPGSFDVVIANPPYRQPGAGRVPPGLIRRTALFERPETLDIFCRSAASALTANGRFCMIYPAAREADAVQALRNSGLAPTHVLPLAPRQNSEPSSLLIEAAKAQAQPCVTLPALAMHEQDSGAFSESALAYCPFLACNAKR